MRLREPVHLLISEQNQCERYSFTEDGGRLGSARGLPTGERRQRAWYRKCQRSKRNGRMPGRCENRRVTEVDQQDIFTGVKQCAAKLGFSARHQGGIFPHLRIKFDRRGTHLSRRGREAVSYTHL